MIFWLCNSIIILSDTLFVASFHIAYHSNIAHFWPPHICQCISRKFQTLLLT